MPSFILKIDSSEKVEVAGVKDTMPVAKAMDYLVIGHHVRDKYGIPLVLRWDGENRTVVRDASEQLKEDTKAAFINALKPPDPNAFASQYELINKTYKALNETGGSRTNTNPDVSEEISQEKLHAGQLNLYEKSEKAYADAKVSDWLIPQTLKEIAKEEAALSQPNEDHTACVAMRGDLSTANMERLNKEMQQLDDLEMLRRIGDV